MFRIGDILFCGIISMHLAAGAFAIREWPLCDYNMFADPFPEISRYKYLEFSFSFEDGSTRKLHRAEQASQGVPEYRFQPYRNDPNNPRVEELMRTKIKIISKTWNQKPSKVRLHVCIAYLDNSSQGFSTHCEIAREFSIEQLLQ